MCACVRMLACVRTCLYECTLASRWQVLAQRSLPEGRNPRWIQITRSAPPFQLTRIITRSGTNVAVDESSSSKRFAGARTYRTSCHGYRTNNNTAPPYAPSGNKRQLIDSLSLSPLSSSLVKLCLSVKVECLLRLICNTLSRVCSRLFA